MTISKAVAIGLAFCFLIGIAAAAGIVGWYLGAPYLLNAWVKEQAGDIQGHIEVLQNLKTGNTPEAIEFLESRLDDDLIVLEPEGHKLQAHVRTEMYAALRAAKKYRIKYPRKSRRGSIDKMVQNVLSRDIPDNVN
jgi:hypothetical protein